MDTSMRMRLLAPFVTVALVWAMIPNAAHSYVDKIEYQLPLGFIVINANSLLQAKSPSTPEGAPQSRALESRFLVYVTAYSSSVDETDSTPHITASGTKTRDGIVASNIFPIGTRLKIPRIFGDQVFAVEDRMHARYTDRLDIWMPSKAHAVEFGKKQAEVVLVES